MGVFPDSFERIHTLSLILNMKLVSTLPLLAGVALADTYFKDDFSDGDAWESRWIQSKHKDDYGAFDLHAGKIVADADNKGLRTSQDAKFYARSANFDAFSNAGKDIAIQFSVKHDQKIDCGGGYVKVFPADFEPEDLHGESNYNLMFGPDICGYSTKKVHVIFNYEGKNHLIKKEIKCKDDQFTHVYTLAIRQDNTYEVFIDGESEKKGSLEEDWDMLAPKEINDPEAEKPEDWDEEMDGEWEAPMINNPEFKGEWKAKKIPNPDYKGPWVHPMIPNPEYKEDPNLYSYDSWGAIGLDLWQVKSGTIFDNFLINDDIDAALAEAKAVIEASRSGEEAAKKEIDDAEEAAAKEAEEAEDDDDEDLDEEDIDDEEDEDDDFEDDEFDGHDEL